MNGFTGLELPAADSSSALPESCEFLLSKESALGRLFFLLSYIDNVRTIAYTCPMQTTIQIRVDKKLKERASKTLENFGIDLSAGLKLFLNNVVAKQSLDFIPMSEEGYRLKNFEEYKKESIWAKKYGKRYKSINELHKDLLAKNGR